MDSKALQAIRHQCNQKQRNAQIERAKENMKCKAVQSVTKQCKELQNNEMQSSTIRYKAMQRVAKQ